MLKIRWRTQHNLNRMMCDEVKHFLFCVARRSIYVDLGAHVSNYEAHVLAYTANV